MNLSDKLFTLIRLGIGLQETADHSFVINAEEWPSLFDMASEQTVLGLVLDGAQKLLKECWPPKMLLLQMVSLAEQIKQRNELLNKKCQWLTRTLEGIGLDSCILKGQGVAALYPNPLSRQSGDIDVWTKTRVVNFAGDINRGAREIIKRLSAVKEAA